MSHTLLDQLRAAITPELLSDACKALNEPQDATTQAVGLALPALIAAIATATRMPQGLSSVLRLVDDPVNDGTLGTQLASLYKGTMVAAPIYRLGSQLLQTALGTRLTPLAQAIAALSGVRPASATALLHILAPHLMDVIGTDHRAGVDKTPEGFARYMEHQKAQLKGTLPAPLADILSGTAVAMSNAVKSAAALAAVATTAAASASATPARQAVVAAPKPSAPPAKKSGIHDEDSRWGLVYLTAFFGIALFALAFGLYGQLYPDTARPIASSETFKPSQPPVPVAPVAPAPKVAEANPADAKPAAPGPAVPASPAPAVKTAEASAATGAAKDSVKDTVKTKAKTKTKTAALAPIVVPPDRIAPAVPGVTSYFGTGQPYTESAAVANPDYKPVVANEGPTIIVPPDDIAPAVPGVTSYFGSSPSTAEAPAVANPDYRPLEADAGPRIIVPPDNIAPAVPGVTSYFGSSASRPEAEAIANPDYKPAAPAAVPVAPAAETPAAVVSGTTQYFGVAPATAEMPAKANPDYKPDAKLTAAIAAAAEGKAVRLPAQAKATVSISPSSGVTTYFGPSPQTSPAACADAVAGAVKSGTVLFRSGSADLTASSLPTLKRIARAFRDCGDMKLRVEGHTDDSGAADLNQKLSEARAKSVVGYLSLRGVEASRLSFAGFGMSRPLVPNNSAANKAQNRRIEFAVEKQ